MRVTGTFLTLIISTSLYHSLAKTTCPNCMDCINSQCLNCTLDALGKANEICQQCLSNTIECFSDIPKTCKLKEFKVHVDAPTHVKYDKEFNATCNAPHDLPQYLNVSYQWLLNNKSDSQNKTMSLRIKERVTLKCTVLSQCGNFSSEDHMISSDDHSPANTTCPNCVDCINSNCLNCTSDALGKEFKVHVDAPTSVKYDKEFNATCNAPHDLPQYLNVSYQWLLNNKSDSQNKTMSLRIKERVTLKCTVLSQCGNFSSEDHMISLDDQITLILVICAIGAVFVILSAYFAMKMKLRQTNLHREAMRRQRQETQREVTTTTSTGY
ncbi:uncharacterized protein LOC134319508 isoform X2 [Trichomycterus rosablanca]